MTPGVYTSPERHWRDPRAVRHARREAIAFCREELARRRRERPGATQVFHDAHEGGHHLAFFRDEFPAVVAMLPERFRAIEVGAGMGWLAALLAATTRGRVLATEVMWRPGETPFCAANASTFRRLMAREPRLARVVRVKGDAIRFATRLGFAHAEAGALPVRTASQDLVYTQNCLEHIIDLGGHFREAARVLRRGGVLYAATEPLYYSPFGHHLWDIAPIPWGHLLWEAEELAEVAVREAGQREWAPGVPLAAAHVQALLTGGLNYVGPSEIRRHLRLGPWRVAAWRDLAPEGHARLAKGLGLWRALRGIPAEALLLEGLRFKLLRERRPAGWQVPLWLDGRTRARLRHLKAWGRG